MRFETFESRIVFDQSLGSALEFEIDAAVDLAAEQDPVLVKLPADIQFRSTSDDFRYESDSLEPGVLDGLVAATNAWADDPEPWRVFQMNDTEAWRKVYRHNFVSFHEDGYIVAERTASQDDTHTLLTVQKHSSCYLHGGIYMRPDYHYRFSFDVRHPESELRWLNGVDGWSIVTQLWGPREGGETVLEPPYSIFSYVRDGTPYWVVRNIGDSSRITQPYQVDNYQSVVLPMTGIGSWQHFDVEYVPNSDGHGLVRTWLNGDLVAEWIDVESSYSANIADQWTGPLNPAFGLYSYDIGDGQEAHFDNMILQCNGEFQSSVSGRVTSGGNLVGGTAVYATDKNTGERFGTYTEKNGVYVLHVPKGEYTVTAMDEATNQEGSVHDVSTLTVSSRTVDIAIAQPATPSPPAPQQLLALTGDVDGDGLSDIINRLEDGSWQVTLMEHGQTTLTGIATPTHSTEETEPSKLDGPALSIPVQSGVAVGETSVWAKWSTDVEWTDIQIADFNGDGLDDIAGRAENGAWWVAESNGSGFANRHWGAWTVGIDWLNVTLGDFNGDGLADIAGRAATNGDWWISTSTGSSFVNSRWGRWSTAIDWEMVAGDFNGDGLDDIAGRASTDGTWWVGQSDGTRFTNSYWGRFTNSVPWSEFKVGDFNGDGLSDIVGRAQSDGTFWVAESRGDGFSNRYWGKWSNQVSWLDVSIGDVDGDGTSDMVGRADSDGSWWIAKSTGQRFQNQYWGAIWSQEVDWLSVAVDDFDGDGTIDLLGVNSHNWWLSV